MADGGVQVSSKQMVRTSSIRARTKAGARVIETMRVGDVMSDRTIYAGISPETGKPMFTTPTDAPLTYTFKQACRYAEQLKAHGHNDWRVPTGRELAVLYNHRAAIQGFNSSGRSPESWYWASTRNDDNNEWSRRFDDGSVSYGWRFLSAVALRCVR